MGVNSQPQYQNGVLAKAISCVTSQFRAPNTTNN